MIDNIFLLMRGPHGQRTWGPSHSASASAQRLRGCSVALYVALNITCTCRRAGLIPQHGKKLLHGKFVFTDKNDCTDKLIA